MDLFTCPRFSVVIPTYNRSAVIRRAVQSVLDQTFSDFELIVVDDGSTDSTPGVLEPVLDQRFRYLRQPNRGRSAARNAGVAASSGEYILFLDSDDAAHPTWLQTMDELAAGPDVGIACVGVRQIISADETGTKVTLPSSMGTLYGGVTGLFLAGSFAVRRDLFTDAGGYAEQLSHSENTELALRVVPHCLERRLTVACAAEPLVDYYADYSASSRSLADQLAGSEYILRHHGQRYRELSPRAYANRCSVAGVSAAKLGRYGQARAYLAEAIRVDLANWRYYGRFAAASLPFLGRAVWRGGSARPQDIGD